MNIDFPKYLTYSKLGQLTAISKITRKLERLSVFLFCLAHSQFAYSAFEFTGRDLWHEVAGYGDYTESAAAVAGWSSRICSTEPVISLCAEKRFNLEELKTAAMFAALPFGKIQLGLGYSRFGWEFWREEMIHLVLTGDIPRLSSTVDTNIETRWKVGLKYGRIAVKDFGQRGAISTRFAVEINSKLLTFLAGVESEFLRFGGFVSQKHKWKMPQVFHNSLSIRFLPGWYINYMETKQFYQPKNRDISLSWLGKNIGFSASSMDSRGFRLACRIRVGDFTFITSVWVHPQLPLSTAIQSDWIIRSGAGNE
jgi:hypothetical protein